LDDLTVIYTIFLIPFLLFILLLIALTINRPRTLTLKVTGQGTTKPSPTTRRYKKGSTATVEAVPFPGWQFYSWKGGAEGNMNPLTIVINSSLTVTAEFVYGYGSVLNQEFQKRESVNFCRSCGFKNAGYNFCPNCGGKISEDETKIY
jgi:hypothetical protein